MFKFWKYTNKKEFAKLFLIRLIVISLSLISPLLISRSIDNALAKNLEETKKYIIWMLLNGVTIHIFYVLEDYFFGINDMEAYLNQFSQINKAVKFYDSKENNIDKTRMVQELGQNFEIVQPFIYQNTLKIILNTIKFVATCFIVYKISPRLLLAFLIIVPISSFVSYKSENNIADVSSDHLEDMKNMKGYLVDQKDLSKEERFLKEKQLPDIKTFYKKFREDLVKKVKYESVIYNIFVYGTLNFAITLTTIISVILIIKGEMTAGDYAAVSIYIGNLRDPMLDLFNTRREYVSGKPAMEAYEEFLNMSPMQFEDEKIEGIELRDYVSLGSEGQKLHQPLDLVFEKGRINLIVGDNGIGKTTLLEALMNLTGRYQGEILINGKALDKGSNLLYEDLVYVPADPVISPYGRLKDKVNGSSGQKKLAQLDLAVKTEKDVYIFDEPTNFLDHKVKGQVLDLIKGLLNEDRIVIVISHDDIFLEDEGENIIRLSKESL